MDVSYRGKLSLLTVSHKKAHTNTKVKPMTEKIIYVPFVAYFETSISRSKISL